MRKIYSAALLLLPLLFNLLLVGQYRDRDRDRDDWNYNRNGDNTWNPSWNGRREPRSGVCFFTDRGFAGNRFCVRQGDRLARLPGNFGDNISSVRIFGKARVVVFNDRNFTGGSQEFRSSIDDLRTRRFRGGNTWNNRISSIAVR